MLPALCLFGRLALAGRSAFLLCDGLVLIVLTERPAVDHGACPMVRLADVLKAFHPEYGWVRMLLKDE